MKYLLDTCVISDFVKGHANTLKQLKAINPAYIAISAITEMEIHYGIKKMPHNAKRTQTIKAIINDLLASIIILPFGNQASEIAGDIRATLAKKGTPIGAYDVLIAATALDDNRTLVTANMKEFMRITRLSLHNWRDT